MGVFLIKMKKLTKFILKVNMQGRSLDEIFELYSFAHPVLGGQNMQDSRFAFNFQIVPRIHVWYDMYIMNGYHRGP